MAICPAEVVDGTLVDECEPENPPLGYTATTLSVGTTAVAYIQLDGPSGVGDVESGDTISFYGAPGQFETSGSPFLGGSAIGVTAESAGASSLPIDPNLTAVVVRNPDGTVAICSDCIAVAPSSQSTSGTGYIGYSYDPSPIYQFGSQLLVGGTVTCTYPVAMFLHYRLQQGSTTTTASRWVNCEDATYVSIAVPDTGFVPGGIQLGVSGGAYIPALSQLASNANGVTTTATYSPPLLIGITLDQTGYRGPGYAEFGATVTCNDAVSGTASVAFTLDGATIDASSAATCGSNGLGYVVFQVPGPWGPGAAGVNASFSADGMTGTTTGVVNIS